jgi:hypothetical protein
VKGQRQADAEHCASPGCGCGGTAKLQKVEYLQTFSALLHETKSKFIPVSQNLAEKFCKFRIPKFAAEFQLRKIENSLAFDHPRFPVADGYSRVTPDL